MQEKDIQIRASRAAAAGHPHGLLRGTEDYTNRGNIITPLKDRIGSQILTHYPRTIEEASPSRHPGGLGEAGLRRGGRGAGSLPRDHRRDRDQARSSEFVDQSSGVSVRLTITFLGNLVSNLERRALEPASAACGRASSTCARRSPP
jgi:magnesium chelatase subunit I